MRRFLEARAPTGRQFSRNRPPMQTPRTLNIGILAHVDAGKTSLTERLLFDYRRHRPARQRRRRRHPYGRRRASSGSAASPSARPSPPSPSATSRSTSSTPPGHSDFIAEVERALGVLDGAVLLLSAVEGVQAQTRVLMKTLRRLRLPTLVFVNKIDRAGARADALLADIRRTAGPARRPARPPSRASAPPGRPCPYRARRPTARGGGGARRGRRRRSWRAVVDGPPPTRTPLRSRARRRAPPTARSTRCYFGSALGGQGVAALVEGMVRLIPPRADRPTATPSHAARSSPYAPAPAASGPPISGSTTGEVHAAPAAHVPAARGGRPWTTRGRRAGPSARRGRATTARSPPGNIAALDRAARHPGRATALGPARRTAPRSSPPPTPGDRCVRARRPDGGTAAFRAAAPWPTRTR